VLNRPNTGVTIGQISTASNTAQSPANEAELTAAEAPVLNAALPMPEQASEPKPQPETDPEPVANRAPDILSISLGCDLVTDSVSIRMGDSAEFFLLVDDESPLDINYVAEMENPDIASVEVDSEGMLLVSGLTLGKNDLSVKVVDSNGLTDTIVIPIIVDL